MQKDTQHRRVEDILTDEHLRAEACEGTEAEKEENGETVLAAEILSVFRLCRTHQATEEMKALGERIVLSIYRYKRHLIFVRISMAAGLLLLIGLPFLFLRYDSSGLITYAENHSAVFEKDYTELVLSGEEVKINSEESQIDYSADGHDIRINVSEQVNQSADEGDRTLNTVVVPYGKRSRVRLSDESVVWLNSGSRLVFPARFTKQKREVFLEGEAVFEVTHDAAHPFRVLTKSLNVEVLGTVFNVTAYSDDSLTSAVLVEGSVELSYPGKALLGKSAYRMTPGRLASYNPATRTISASEVDTRLYTSWRDGYLIFHRELLGDILKKISRHHHVEIRVEDATFTAERFSGQLDLAATPEELLQRVSEIIDARVEHTDNQFVIKR
jgi:ferric-dicitrate binding protein FerR (iron transport regulator)